jgi:hypothetical protein
MASLARDRRFNRTNRVSAFMRMHPSPVLDSREQMRINVDRGRRDSHAIAAEARVSPDDTRYLLLIFVAEDGQLSNFGADRIRQLGVSRNAPTVLKIYNRYIRNVN